MPDSTLGFVELAAAIRRGDVVAVRRSLAAEPELATAHHHDEHGHGRTALHVATDWPGHFPAVAETIAALVAAGADVDAEFRGPHRERPLHWAASSGDRDAAVALIAAGADLTADGGVLTGGPPLDDAVIFRQYDVAHLLVVAGAPPAIWHAAALGLDVLAALIPTATSEQRTNALWHAAAGGQRGAVELLLAAGADPAWVGWEGQTAAAVAAANGHAQLAGLLPPD